MLMLCGVIRAILIVKTFCWYFKATKCGPTIKMVLKAVYVHVRQCSVLDNSVFAIFPLACLNYHRRKFGSDLLVPK